MKKRFISAMLFGALVLAAGTSVTSCSDYDDEIQNLQTQIDQITSSNPVTADDIKAADRDFCALHPFDFLVY